MPAIGATEKFAEVNFVSVTYGRFFTATELEHRRRVVVLGNNPYEALFQRMGLDPIGKKVRVGAIEFTVVGVLQKRPSVIGDQDDFSLSDLIEDQGAEIPVDAATRVLLNEAVQRALRELSPREQEIVRLRFGLEDGRIRTLEEVGQMFGVTRERVRQIEMKTLAKLRQPSVSRPLRDYFEAD